MKTYANDDDCVIEYANSIRETEKALLFSFGKNGVYEEKWIAKSCLLAHDAGWQTLTIPFWLVEKQGLEDYIRD